MRYFVGFSISLLLATALIGATGTTSTASGKYTLQDKATIEQCIQKTQRNSQHARACIGQATRVCETLREMASSAGIKDCMMRENAYWDEILNDRYRQLMAAFSKKNAKKLKAMQRSWLAWRKEKCELPYMLYEGGSMAGVLAAGCIMETTAVRALELDEAAMAP